MDWRPRLREDVHFIRSDDGSQVALYDPLVERRVNLGPIAHAVASRLDGKRTVPEILETVALERPGTDRATLASAIRHLLLLNLIEGAGTAILERFRRVKGGEQLSYAILDEARFACQGSGECCQNYHFGPLTDEDVKRLEGLDIAGTYPELGPGPYWEELPLPNGQKERFLKTKNDCCMFLLRDARCGLHAAFGADSKPGLCRLYPLVPLATIWGVKVYDNGECASFPTSARSGPTYVEDFERIKALLPERHGLYHPVVLLGNNTPADYGYLLPLQAALCEVARIESGTSADALVAMGALARAYSDALGSCPLEPGEPQATMKRVLEADFARLFPPARPAPAPDDVRRGCEGVGEIAGRLLRACAESAIRAQPSPKDYLSARLAREMTQVLHLVGAIAMHAVDPARVPLTDFYREIAAVRASDPDIEAAFRLSFRNAAFGHRIAVEERAVAGLLRLAMAYLVTLYGARLHAATERRADVRRDDFGFGHMLANRILRQAPIAGVFVQHEALAWRVIDAVPALAAARAGGGGG